MASPQRIDVFAPLFENRAFSGLIDRAEQFRCVRADKQLSTVVVEALYGKMLATSVSRLEDFAACPFKFFIRSGLRAEERKQFELDVREQGSFQHEVLALFHRALMKEGKRWRDLTPREARERIARGASNRSTNIRAAC
jgi:ATP-dependent helicase/nuclease subunit B